MSHPWKFEQLGGPKKTLYLLGYSAPFGRPRQKAIFRDKIKIRQQTTGFVDGSVTRHLFGPEFEPWALEGRFTDREGGPGYAQARVREVQDFVRDQQEVTIAWGDVVAYRGFVDSFDPGWESDAEVEWKLSILIDEDALAEPELPAPAPPSPREAIATIARALATAEAIEKLPELRGSLLDALSSGVSAFSSAFGAVAKAAGALAQIETALAGELQRMRAGLGQLRTAIITVVNVGAAARADLGNAKASSAELFADLDVEALFALEHVQRLDREAALSLRGKLRTTYLVKAGDTWESIASQVFGSPDKADELRRANDARYGERPIAGRTVTVPTTL